MNNPATTHFIPDVPASPSESVAQRPQAQVTAELTRAHGANNATSYSPRFLVMGTSVAPSKVVSDTDVGPDYFSAPGKAYKQSPATRVKHRVCVEHRVVILRLADFDSNPDDKDSGDFHYFSAHHTNPQPGDLVLRGVSPGALVYLAETKNYRFVVLVPGELYELSLRDGSVRGLSWSVLYKRTIDRVMYHVQGSQDSVDSMQLAIAEAEFANLAVSVNAFAVAASAVAARLAAPVNDESDTDEDTEDEGENYDDDGDILMGAPPAPPSRRRRAPAPVDSRPKQIRRLNPQDPASRG